MKIGFDVSQTGTLKAGCGYFADSLIRHLISKYPENDYLLYSTFGTSFWDPQHGKTTFSSKDKNSISLLNNFSYKQSFDLWNNSPINEERIGNPDIVHSNNFSCPNLTKAKIIYTLYDLSFIDCPNFTSEENRVKCFNGVFDAAIYADFIISISEYSKLRFLEIFPHFPNERIYVTGLGSRFQQSDIEKEVPNLKPSNFWLSVCTVEPRKNLRRTLLAYRKYIDEEVQFPKPLVLAGGKGWLENDFDDYINNLGLKPYVQTLGYVDDPTLHWLYKNCWAFIYPSLYEGFGLPVLEAMSLGAAVITSNTTSLPEVGGDAVYYVDPNSEAEIAAAFKTLDNKDLVKELKNKSQKQSKEYSWDKTATMVNWIYKEALKLPKRS